MKYVIIGNAAAGIGTVEGIREYDKNGEILIISDEKYDTYSRPLISYWLKEAVTEENMRYRNADFYEKNNVKTMLDTKVIAIDPDKKEVVIEGGENVPYDKLMVATGSKPFVPPMQGMEKIAKKFSFMKKDDAKAVKEAVFDGARVLIVGAGLIGLKAAEALEHYNAKMTVVDLANRILPSILDEAASEIMQKHIESKGVRFILNTSVSEFSENSAKLSNGETVDFDMVILAVGVRPNVELIKEAGGNVGRGIITDNRQQTSLKDIYAAGDCTESYDISIEANRILAILPNAHNQGVVAGKNMAGKEAYYLNAFPMNAIGFFGLHIITAGSYGGEPVVETDGTNYKKLVVKDKQLKGFILMGKYIKRAGIYTSLIREHITADECDYELMLKAPQMMAFNRERRNDKLAGGKGNEN